MKYSNYVFTRWLLYICFIVFLSCTDGSQATQKNNEGEELHRLEIKVDSIITILNKQDSILNTINQTLVRSPAKDSNRVKFLIGAECCNGTTTRDTSILACKKSGGVCKRLYQ